MKKLMIAMAVVALAAVSQAASFSWSASGVTGYNTTDLYSGLATIYAYANGDDTKTIIFTDTATMTAGAISKVIDSSSFVAGSKYKFYYTLEDAAGNTFKSSTKTGTANSTSTPNVAFLASGSWTAAPVPEPTSAMFLLLGVAGLALKRRRA